MTILVTGKKSAIQYVMKLVEETFEETDSGSLDYIDCKSHHKETVVFAGNLESGKYGLLVRMEGNQIIINEL